MSSKPLLAFTVGEPEGVGPELLARALRDPRLRRAARWMVLGPADFLKRFSLPSDVAVLDPGVPVPAPRRRRGPSAEGGLVSFAAFRLGTELALRGLIQGLVTSPICKESWARAGVGFTEHTEFLLRRTGAAEAGMVLLAGPLRAVLVTRHIPLRRVPGSVDAGKIAAGARLARSAARGLGIRRPRIGLCALNPHAGDNGLMGTEEARVLRPAVRRLRRTGARVRGPLPADAAWAACAAGALDILVALYHDQAMAPLKAAAPKRVVNWTAGLPLVRTSPGHGTAFDIAGRGRADATATIEAALLAARLAAGGRKA